MLYAICELIGKSFINKYMHMVWNSKVNILSGQVDGSEAILSWTSFKWKCSGAANYNLSTLFRKLVMSSGTLAPAQSLTGI